MYALVENNKLVNCIMIHPTAAAKFHLKDNDQKLFRFGVKEHLIKIKVSRLIAKNSLSISSNIIRFFRLPLTSFFQLMQKDDVIVLGPFIGILAAKSKTILKRKLKPFLVYARYYTSTFGTIAIFSLDQINYQKKEIAGFIYNPTTDAWEEKTIIFPNVVLVKMMISAKKRKQLQSKMKNMIINSIVYNKWESYQLLSPLVDHLPATFLYKSPQQLLECLDKYQSVYVKPIFSLGGKFIKKISRKSNGAITVVSHHKRKPTVLTLANKEAVFTYLQQTFKQHRWIIQQPISLITYNKSLIDFRCVVVKNAYGKWDPLALVAKYGAKESIVSNISAGGRAEMGIATLKKVLGLSDQKATMFAQKIMKLATEAVQVIENAGGHLGTAGVDIGIDENQKLWLIEVNLSNPGHNIVVDARKKGLYLQIIKTSLAYLMMLEGFQLIENGDNQNGISVN